MILADACSKCALGFWCPLTLTVRDRTGGSRFAVSHPSLEKSEGWGTLVVSWLKVGHPAIWDHVYADHALTHKLNEFGIVHEAEEYNGLWDADPYWGAEGRVIADVLPFFQQHLQF